jgi:hypothetical protein
MYTKREACRRREGGDRRWQLGLRSGRKKREKEAAAFLPHVWLLLPPIMSRVVPSSLLLSLLLAAVARGDPNSCAGHCGSYAPNCWCSASKCPGGDKQWPCCADYKAQCGGGGNQLTLKSLASSASDAVCLDGSAAGYYLRKGTTDSFLIYFQGGGWCYDQKCAATRQGTITNCKERSKSSLGSSKNWGATMNDPNGMLSASAVKNPNFHSWNVIYVPYCDGGSFSGDVQDPIDGLYFRGKRILDAVIADLKNSTGIQKAGQVVLSGGSAGASTVYYHADYIKETLAASTGTEVMAMPDAGFFLDLPSYKVSRLSSVGLHIVPNNCPPKPVKNK